MVALAAATLIAALTAEAALMGATLMVALTVACCFGVDSGGNLGSWASGGAFRLDVGP